MTCLTLYTRTWPAGCATLCHVLSFMIPWTLSGMIARLNLEQKGEDVSFIKQVATELFSDGTTNWGRIASLLTFGAMLCKYQNDRGHSKYVRLVGEEISSYLLTEQRDWILRNKAWVSLFIPFYRSFIFS